MTSLDKEIKELFEKIGDTKNILIGNGFSLSHPELGNSFKWDMNKAFACNNILPNQSKFCPEKDLRQIRVNAVKKTLKYYFDAFKEKLGTDSNKMSDILEQYKNFNNCSDFLDKLIERKARIFTLNYDPIFYFEFLRNLNKHKKDFADGFFAKNDDSKDENGFINQCCIKNNLNDLKEERSVLFYLHGSWFICANDRDKERKEGKSVEDRLRKLDGEDEIELINTEDQRPFLILEDRWRVKKAMIEMHSYFSFCYEQLKNISGNLLVFGCSFENDDHILEAIVKAMNENKLREVFITYIDRGEIKDQKSQMEIIKDKMKVIPENKFTFDGEEPNVIFLKIPKNLIWKPSN